MPIRSEVGDRDPCLASVASYRVCDPARLREASSLSKQRVFNSYSDGQKWKNLPIAVRERTTFMRQRTTRAPKSPPLISSPWYRAKPYLITILLLADVAALSVELPA